MYKVAQEVAVEVESIGRRAERMALRYAAPTGVIALFLAWWLNRSRNPVPFGDDLPSFGALTLFFGVFVALIYGAFAFADGSRRQKDAAPVRYHKHWKLTLVPLVIAYAIMVGVIIGVALQLVSMAFRDLALEIGFAAAFVGLTTAIVTYFVITDMLQVAVGDVLRIFAVILIGGLFFSAVKVQNPLWWEQSFSYLGTMRSDARAIFNATIITSGILLIILQQYFMEDFFILRDHGKLSPKRTEFVRGSLIALGVMMMLVGIFPFGVSSQQNFIHDYSAYGMAAILIIYMAGCKWFVPGLSREFYVASWILMAMTLIAVTLMVVGAINTVGVELLAFTFGGAWLLMFIKSVELYAEHVEAHATQ